MIYKFFIRVAKIFSGKGLGKIPGVVPLYKYLCKITRPKGIVSVECFEHKLYIDGRDKNIAPSLIAYGTYESFETETFKKQIKNGDTVLDIGAHVGYYTLVAAKMVGESGKVFAFEPEPNNFSLLKKNIQINGYRNVVMEQKAVSDKNGVLNLYVTGDNTAMHRVYKTEYTENYIEIGSIRLDDYFKEFTEKIDVIKIDIEGAELSAFRGMSNILTKNHDVKIFCEFNPDSIKEFGAEPKEFLKFLTDNGFVIYHINEKLKKIVKTNAVELLQMYSPGTKWLTNLICLRE